MKKFLIVLAVILAVVGIALLIYNSQPEVIARNALAGAIGNVLEREEISPLVNMFKKGSLEMNASVEMNSLGLVGMASNLQAGGKFYFSANDLALMIDNLNFKVGDVGLSADAYIGKDLVYVGSKELFDGAVGAVRGEMADEFEGSLLIDWLGLDGEGAESIKQVLESYDSGKDKELAKELKKHFKKYLITFVLAVEKYADYDVENASVEINGETVNARVVEMTIDEGAAADVLAKIYNKMKGDDKLRRAVVAYLEDYENFFKYYGILSADEDVDDLYGTFIEKFGAYVDRLDEESSDSDSEIVFKVVTPKTSAKLMQISMSEKSGGEKETVFTLDLGKKGIKKTDQISFGVGEVATYVYKINSNGSDKYEATLKLDFGDDEPVSVFSLSIDKSGKAFELVTDDYTLSGDFISEKDSTTVTVRNISAGSVELSNIDITFIIREKDKMPEPIEKDKIMNVFAVPEATVNVIADKLVELGFGDDKDDVADLIGSIIMGSIKK